MSEDKMNTQPKHVDYNDLPIDLQKSFYHPICNKEEIERIFDLQDGSDYLLKLRADTIIDHMRLFRVYRNKALEMGENWSLEDSFEKQHIINVRNKLPQELQSKFDSITFGNIFSTEPNGDIFNSEFGIISTISDSLKYFVEYMNLGLGDFNQEVPMHIRKNAIRIAIRVMLQTEALDFKMDPRGIIPKSIQDSMSSTYPFQMQFLIGHEFAHYILGHLKEDNTVEKFLIKAMFSSQTDYAKINSYTVSQKKELEADIYAIKIPLYDDMEMKLIFESTLHFFADLAIYEAVKDCLFPPIGYQTHPDAMSRYYNLLDNIKKPKDFNNEYFNEELPKLVREYKEIFIDDVSCFTDEYETYGSVYLDKPNTKWRGRELIDRVDYY